MDARVPQDKGSAIGMKVMEDVPYITGLYHVEGITPEAVQQERVVTPGTITAQAFLEYVKDEMNISIKEDGVVEVE